MAFARLIHKIVEEQLILSKGDGVILVQYPFTFQQFKRRRVEGKNHFIPRIKSIGPCQMDIIQNIVERPRLYAKIELISHQGGVQLGITHLYPTCVEAVEIYDPLIVRIASTSVDIERFHIYIPELKLGG